MVCIVFRLRFIAIYWRFLLFLFIGLFGKKMARKNCDPNLQEEVILRKIVYTEALIAGTIMSKDKFPTRVLVEPNQFERIYILKRVAVLKLLLDIVKGGRPDDALKASAYACALEQGPAYAAMDVYSQGWV